MPDRQAKFVSAGVVVARAVEEGWLLLVLRSWQNWDFPKGMVEAGETPLQAAVRETEEETGISGLDFRWGHDFLEVGPYGSRRKVARYYLAETREQEVLLPVSPELGRPEHDEWRWVTPERARQLLPPRLQSVLNWALTRLD